jgi:hypothetical protein
MKPWADPEGIFPSSGPGIGFRLAARRASGALAAGEPPECVLHQAPAGGEARMGELADELRHRGRQFGAAWRLYRVSGLDRLFGLVALTGYR